jgi:hypothetical protein
MRIVGGRDRHTTDAEVFSMGGPRDRPIRDAHALAQILVQQALCLTVTIG